MAGESASSYARRQREKAERHTRVAEMYERGAAGESETAARLDELRAYGWVILHDLRWPGRPRANIDHIAIGPGGVYVIDSKNWSGSVAVLDGVLRQNGRWRENEVTGAAEAALAITGVLGQVPATGVLCFVREEPLTGWARDVMICSTSTLTEMLKSRPLTLPPGTIQRLAGHAAATLPSASAPPQAGSRQPHSRARATASTRRGAKRGSSSIAPRLIGLALLAILLLVAGPLIVEVATSTAKSAVESLAGPTVKLGESATVDRTNARPELKVTALRVVNTRPVVGAQRPVPGSRLVAVDVRIQNLGDRPWSLSSSGTSMSVVDAAGRSHPWSAPRRITAGRALPPKSMVRPRQEIEGWVSFELPKRSSVEDVFLKMGPGLPDRVTWRVSDASDQSQ